VHHLEQAAHATTGMLDGLAGWVADTVARAIVGLTVGAVMWVHRDRLRVGWPRLWVVGRMIAPDWPGEKVALMSPGAADPADNPEAALIIHDDGPIRAAGFSDSGRVLVVATSRLYLWTRDEVTG
jgi:hypothetical protein